MKLNSLFFFPLAGFFIIACTKSTAPSCANDQYTTVGSALSKPNGSSITLASAANVLPLSVNGTECNNNNSYLNKPCASVTVCKPGSTAAGDCVTINDLLVDTGSVGLRVFKSALGSVALDQVTVNSKNLAECVEYGDGSKQWGPVKTADLYLGGEPKVSIPIQVIDSTFTDSAQCGTSAELDVNPATTGFNGILGLGNRAQDCGTSCVSFPLGLYFSCNGGGCTDTTVSLNKQVTQPVANLPTDNNGLILKMPSVGLGGQPSAEGYLVLGIGTQSNNSASGVTAYPTDSSGFFTVTYDGKSLDGFTDSGSNLFIFPGSPNEVTDCGCDYAGFYCPASTQTLSATVTGISGFPSSAVPFQLGNFINLATTSNWVFVELGAGASGLISGLFDFGLPFYLGRNVYIGIQGKSAPTLGTGPYVAF
jgi:hypothetical protein